MASLDTNQLHEALTERLAWLQGLARHLVRDEAAADDLVQDTMAVALDRHPATDRPLEPWLRGVLQKLHLQRLRRGGRRARREAARAVPEAVPGAAEVAARLELVEHLVLAVRELPEPFRTAVALRYESGLEPAEIARRLGVKGSTVRSRIREGLARLRVRLDDRPGSRARWVALLIPLAHANPGPPAPPVLATAGTAWLGAALLAVSSTVWFWWPDPDLAADEPTAESTIEAPAVAPTPTAAPTDPERTPIQDEPAPRDPGPAPAHTDLANANVTGRVMLASGAPAAGVRIGVVSARPYPIARFSPSLGSRSLLIEDHTDPTGEFALRVSPDALLQLVAFDTEGLPVLSPPFRTSAAGHRADMVLGPRDERFELESSGATRNPGPETFRTLQARAIWSDGSPARHLEFRWRQRFAMTEVALRAGFRVHWRDPRADGTTSDDDGRFTLSVPDALPSGRIGIEVLDEDGSYGILPGRDAELGVLIVPARATLGATVRRDALESWQPTAIGISNGDGVVHASRIANDGTTTFPPLAAGRYELRWLESPERAHDITYAFEVGDDQVAGTQLELAPGVHHTHHLDRQRLPLIEGEVRIDAEPASAWGVTLYPPTFLNGAPDLALASLPLDPAGRLRTRVSRSGEWQVRVSPRAGSPRSPLFVHDLTVTQEPTSFAIRLETVVVSGRWSGRDPAEDVWLRTPLAQGGTWIAPVELEPGGTYRIPNAAPGRGELVLADGPAILALNASALTTIDVPPGGHADLDLR